MGKRGPAPQPTKLKLLKGETRPSRVNKREPQLPPTAPRCPTWLNREAKAEWRRIVPQLDKFGLLATIDRGELTAYCVAWATFVEASRLVDRLGLVVEGERGFVKNPALQIMRDQAAIVRAFGSDFGLSPSARTHLTINDDVEDDLEARMAARRAAREQGSQ